MAISDLGGLRQLGELLGRLHTLPEGPGAMARDGGAWHHLAEGGPSDEVAAAARLLADAAGLVSAGERRLYDSMSAELGTLDTCHGLPQAMIHPDFVSRTSSHRPTVGLWQSIGRAPAGGHGFGRSPSCCSSRAPRTCAGSTSSSRGTAAT